VGQRDLAPLFLGFSGKAMARLSSARWCRVGERIGASRRHTHADDLTAKLSGMARTTATMMRNSAYSARYCRSRRPAGSWMCLRLRFCVESALGFHAGY